METRAVAAKGDLNWLKLSIPADATEYAGLREAFDEAIKWLDVIAEKCATEAHNSLSKTAPAGECPCGTCRAERYMEVITNLSREELLQVVAAEIALQKDAEEQCVKCATLPENTVQYSVGGAGTSTD